MTTEPLNNQPQPIIPELKAATTGRSTGGYKGIRYQALWQILACANSHFTENGNHRLTQTVIEGDHHPFDDVEIRYPEWLTLFQAKHVKGNVKVSEIAPKDSKKDDPFSLPKYLKGMMKVDQVLRGKCHFILCTNRPLVTTEFRYGNRKPKLGVGWWQENLLKPVKEEHLDPLLTRMGKDSEKVIKTGGGFFKFRMRHVKKMVAGEFSGDTRGKLLSVIHRSIDKCYGEPEDHEDEILEFFKRFQLWVGMPDEDELENQIVSLFEQKSIAKPRIVFNAFEKLVLSQWKDRDAIVTADDVEGFFTQAKNRVKTLEWRYSGRAYYRSNYLGVIQTAIHEGIKQFIKGEGRICLLSSTYWEEVKYALCSTLRAENKNLSLFNDWSIINAEEHLRGDHPNEASFKDIFDSNEIKILVIDQAHDLLEEGKLRLELPIPGEGQQLILISDHAHSSQLASKIQGLEPTPV